MGWLAEDNPCPEVLKTGFSSGKIVITIFFNTQGAVDILHDKATIVATYYTEVVLAQVLQNKAKQARTVIRACGCIMTMHLYTLQPGVLVQCKQTCWLSFLHKLFFFDK